MLDHCFHKFCTEIHVIVEHAEIVVANQSLAGGMFLDSLNSYLIKAETIHSTYQNYAYSCCSALRNKNAS